MRSRIYLASEMPTKFINVNASPRPNVHSGKDLSLCGNLPISRKLLLVPVLRKLSVQR